MATKQKQPTIEFPELDKLIAIQAEAQKELKQKGEKAVKAALKSFFSIHPEVSAIVWEQYIPGFNDGDPCTFTLTEVRAELEELKNKNPEDTSPDAYYDEYEDGTASTWWLEKNGHKKLAKDLSALERKLNKLENVLESVFGIDVKITVNPKKIIIDEYDCGY